MKAKQLKFKDLDELMEFNENQVRDIHLYNIILTIHSNEWVKALELGLEYFVEQEEYETCAHIRNLLIKIKTKKK
jgi:protein-arginine kinase activator protein McsA